MRQYFYHVDLLGRLFSESSPQRRSASCLRAEKVLAFFFAQLRANDTGEHRTYPWVSQCGKEMNFVSAEDTPIVFVDLVAADTASGAALSYGGSLRQPFEPTQLRLDADTGRLFHPLSSHRHLGSESRMMLICSHLVSELNQRIHVDDERDEMGTLAFEWRGVLHPIRTAEGLSTIDAPGA